MAGGKRAQEIERYQRAKNEKIVHELITLLVEHCVGRSLRDECGNVLILQIHEKR